MHLMSLLRFLESKSNSDLPKNSIFHQRSPKAVKTTPVVQRRYQPQEVFHVTWHVNGRSVDIQPFFWFCLLMWFPPPSHSLCATFTDGRPNIARQLSWKLKQNLIAATTLCKTLKFLGKRKKKCKMLTDMLFSHHSDHFAFSTYFSVLDWIFVQ